MSRPALPPFAIWRGCCIGLILWAGSGAALAQVSTERASERDFALVPARYDALAVASPYEVTAVRSRVLARPVSLPQLRGPVPNDLAALTYRVWRSHGRADLGVGVGTLGYVVPSAEGRFGTGTDTTQALVGAVPTVSMGVRFRVTDEHALFVDAYRARGPAAGAAGAGYGSKLGAEWRPAKSTLGLERGALGMQLESGYRVSLKVRRGGPSLYLRGQF